MIKLSLRWMRAGVCIFLLVSSAGAMRDTGSVSWWGLVALRLICSYYLACWISMWGYQIIEEIKAQGRR